MPYLDYNQSNGYLLPPYIEVKTAASDYGAKTKDALREALKTVEANIERHMAEGLAIDKAEDSLYSEDRTGQELPREVKQAWRRETPL